MPRRFRMDDIRQRCLRRVDLETDLSIAKDECNALISEQYGDMYSVVAHSGLRYFEYVTDIVSTGLNYLPEPVDHLATVDTVERILDANTGRLVRLKQLMSQERTYWAGRTGQHARRWELVDDRIYLYPTPPAGETYRLRYIPQPPDLKAYADADVIDVVTPDGEAFLIWGVGVKLLAKSRSDVTLCIQEREAARERLTEWAALRSFNDPMRWVVEDDDDDFLREGDWRYDR